MLDHLAVKNKPVSIRMPSDAELLFLATTFLCIIVSAYFIPAENLNTYILYVGFLLSSLFFVFLSDLITDSFQKKIIYILGLFLFGFLMAFRDKTGIDDYVYEKIFNRIVKYGALYEINRSDMEKGYLGLNYLISFFGIKNYVYVQSIVCYISVIFWGVAFWKLKNKCNLSVLFLLLWSNYYFFVMYAGLVRIFLALPIALIAIVYIIQKKLKHAVFFILLASLLHKSSFITILLVPLIHEKVVSHWKAYVLLLFCAIPFLFIFISKVLVPILGARYAGYGNIGAFTVSLGAFDILPLLLIGIYFSRFVNEAEIREYTIGLFLMILSIVFSIWSSLVSLGRLIFFANLGILIVASNIFKQKPMGFIEKFVPCIFIVYSFVYVVHTNFLNPISMEYLFPYKSYLE